MRPFIVRLPPAKAQAVIDGAKAEGVSMQRWIEARIPSEGNYAKSETAR